MEENILYESHPAMFRDRPFAYILCIILIPAFGLGLIILLSWWIKVLHTTFTVTDERIILRKGFFSKHTNEIYHTDVNNVQIDQNIIQRIFNVGDLRISSAGQAGIEIIAMGIPEPELINDIIAEHHEPV